MSTSVLPLHPEMEHRAICGNAIIVTVCGEHYWVDGKPIRYDKPQAGHNSFAEQRDGLGLIDPR